VTDYESIIAKSVAYFTKSAHSFIINYFLSESSCEGGSQILTEQGSYLTFFCERIRTVVKLGGMYYVQSTALVD